MMSFKKELHTKQLASNALFDIELNDYSCHAGNFAQHAVRSSVATGLLKNTIRKHGRSLARFVH